MFGSEQPKCIFWKEKYSTDFDVAQVSKHRLLDYPLRPRFKSQEVMCISVNDYNGILHVKTARIGFCAGFRVSHHIAQK